jgi:hypothetical protein
VLSLLANTVEIFEGFMLLSLIACLVVVSQLQHFLLNFKQLSVLVPPGFTEIYNRYDLS